MTLQTDIFDALSGLVAGRVHRDTVPQTPRVPITPAIVFQFISNEIAEDICGSGGPALANTRIQVDSYSVDQDTADTLHGQVIAAMESIQPPTRWNGDIAIEPYDADLKLFRRTADFIHYPSSQ